MEYKNPNVCNNKRCSVEIYQLSENLCKDPNKIMPRTTHFLCIGLIIGTHDLSAQPPEGTS